jgi:extradiol dioxygenase family protein
VKKWVAVEFFDGQLVEMLTEQTEVTKKGEAADHCVAFCLVRPRIKSRNGAAAIDS